MGHHIHVKNRIMVAATTGAARVTDRSVPRCSHITENSDGCSWPHDDVRYMEQTPDAKSDLAQPLAWAEA